MLTKRILIVEDDYDVAEMLLMYFTSHKYEVYHADNGRLGIELARKKFPNLILLDVMLPEMNGYEVCDALRRTNLTKHIPVIFLTQRDSIADKVEGLELGADDYIPKPFHVDELRLRVDRSIDRATRESLYERRTGLPTGPMVDMELNRNADNRTVYQFDILGFQAFTDAYGFMVADDVVAFAAKTIREAVTAHGSQNDFIGINKEQFIVLTRAESPETLQQAIIEKFNQGVRAFYTFVDVERGGILLHEGTADEILAPLMHFKQTEATSEA